MTFGKDAKNIEHFSWGASAGWMGAGAVGFEVDFNHTPNFFEPKDSSNTTELFGSNNVTSFMGNVIVGAPVGGQTGPGIRPYVSGGVGLLKTSVRHFEVVDNDFFYFQVVVAAEAATDRPFPYDTQTFFFGFFDFVGRTLTENVFARTGFVRG
jgi:hypothetical protein